MHVIPGEQAYASLRRNRTGWWARHVADTPPAPSRTRKTLLLASVQPRFKLSLDDKIFTIGSCFARHIEKHLEHFGYRFETRNPKFFVGPDECTSPSGFYNKFTTHAMLNELKWALGKSTFPPEAYFSDDKGRWYDGQLLANFASRERVAEVRDTVQRVTSTVADADVLILTLGLVEAWFDEQTSQYLNVAPPAPVVRANPGRFSVHVLDYKSNYDCLEEIYSLVTGVNPNMRVVVTVSPVPLGSTFTGQDVAVANSYSKSTLRAVAGDFAAKHESVQYFPSYEIVTESSPVAAWMEDAVHVRTEIVECVISYFLSEFLLPEQAANVDLEGPRKRLHAKIEEILNSEPAPAQAAAEPVPA